MGTEPQKILLELAYGIFLPASPDRKLNQALNLKSDQEFAKVLAKTVMAFEDIEAERGHFQRVGIVSHGNIEIFNQFSSIRARADGIINHEPA